MDDGGITDRNGKRLEEAIERALRRAGEESRPREEFRRALRKRFVEGALAPADRDLPPPDEYAPDPEEAVPPRGGRLRVPRFLAYGGAAAAAVLAAFLSGALAPRAVPDPVVPPPPALSPLGRAVAAAERRVQRVPVLAGRLFRTEVVEDRPVLLTTENAFGDLSDLARLVRHLAAAESLLDREFPGLAARAGLPPVTVVAPTRDAFLEVVAPRMDPVPVSGTTVAFALDPEGVLLLSPEILDDRNPPCEPLDIAHEAVHRWLHARRSDLGPLPLWVEEGLADVASQAGSGLDTRRWSRQVLGAARSGGMDPFDARRVLEFTGYRPMAAFVAENAFCEERPYSLLPVFHAHADSLVLFLLEGEGTDGTPLRDRFESWLERVLSGERFDATATAKALGFEDPEVLLAARDAWLEEPR